MAGRRIIVDILGDASQFDRATKQATTSAGKFSNVMKGVGAGIGIGLVGAATMATDAVVQFAFDSVKAASSLNETLTKSRVIFGQGADAVIRWGESADQSLGLSERAALDAASGFAGLFKTVGMSLAESTTMSQQMVQMGTDLASFFNTDMETALGALKSGLNGEVEPLRQFNVFLSETAVSAKLAQMGVKRVGGQFTEAQKATARYQLILEQTKDAQGDFARTSDGLANSSRTLDAKLENLQARFGEGLTPAVLGATNAIIALFDLIDDRGPATLAKLGEYPPKVEELGVAASVAVGKYRAFVGGIEAGTSSLTAALQEEGRRAVQAAVETKTGIVRSNRKIEMSYADLASYLLGDYTKHFDTAMAITEARADLHNAKTDQDRAQAYADLARYEALSGKDYDKWLKVLERLAASTKGKVHDAYVAAIGDLLALRAQAQTPITVKVKYKSSGGPGGVRTAASGGPRTGLTWVGEEGPELVNLPAGSYVNTAAQSRTMAGGSGVTVVVNGNIYGPSGVDELMDMMARRLRLYGV